MFLVLTYKFAKSYDLEKKLNPFLLYIVFVFS